MHIFLKCNPGQYKLNHGKIKTSENATRQNDAYEAEKQTKMKHNAQDNPPLNKHYTQLNKTNNKN